MRILMIAAILATSSPAVASFPQEPPAEYPGDPMEDYFDGEIRGGWILTGMGVAGLTTGGILLAADGDVAEGASYVTLTMGVAHLGAGIYINIASRVRKRVYRVAIEKNSTVWLELERKRMKGVSTGFLVLKIVEVGLIAGGATMAYVGSSKEHPRLEGAGYALAAEAAATLLFDIVAARRAHRYRARLDRIRDRTSASILDDSWSVTNIAHDIAGQPVLVVGRGFAF